MWKPQQFVYTKFGDFMTLNPVRNPALFRENHQFVAACVPKAVPPRTELRRATSLFLR